MIGMKINDFRRKVLIPLKKQMEEDTAKFEGALKDATMGVAETILSNTPVDTGNYADSMNVYTTQGHTPHPPSTRSDRKPRGQSRPYHINMARDRMQGQVQAADLQATPAIYISNGAVYAHQVESRHAPFTIARRNLNVILQASIDRWMNR